MLNNTMLSFYVFHEYFLDYVIHFLCVFQKLIRPTETKQNGRMIFDGRVFDLIFTGSLINFKDLEKDKILMRKCCIYFLYQM